MIIKVARWRHRVGEEIANGQKKAIYTDINGNISNNYEATHIIVEELTITIN